MMNARKHWLGNPRKEMLVILAPAIVPVIIVFLFNDYFAAHQEVDMWWWLVLVLMIDVGHVYSTLFRFYWEKETFQKYKRHLVVIPVVCFVLGAGLHFVDSSLFWRILAYAAVYHFIRQQYGFVRLYSRHEKQPRLIRLIDTLAIYSATLYPVLYWHFYLTQDLSWFVPHDFIAIHSAAAAFIARILFFMILAVYLMKEVILVFTNREINIPRNGIIIGTYLSWYAGIVWFKGDLTFTLLNVVAHGIPYMGLVWMYGEKKSKKSFSFGWRGLTVFALVLITLAYFEEALWDVLVWKDHVELFPFFVTQENLTNPILLSIIVPLLVLPQLTHYVLDGFIWRFSKDASARAE